MFGNNVGPVDSAIRAAFGTLLMGVAAVVADQYPIAAFATALVAAIVLGTAMVGVCPLYRLLGFDTRPGQQPRFAAGRDLAHHLR